MNKKALTRGLIVSTFLVFTFILAISFSSAWFINGTVYDRDGNLLVNANISVSAGYFPGGGAPTYPFANSTNSSGTGAFILNVTDNSTCSYQIKILHKNETTGAVDFVGQTLPYFPYQELGNNLTNVNFYLKEAGTINVTAVNSSGGRVSFNYQLKDTSLGYTIESQWTSRISEANIYIPRDRNYSVMIYPDQSMPVSFDWSNFSATDSYTLPGGISTYNVTTKFVHKKFNTTMSIVRVEGYINNSAISGWDEFTIVPYLLEPGNMIFVSSAGYGTMPFNMSAWNGQTDVYNYSTGYYNISLPGPAELQTIMLFASGKNNSNYYGSYRNVSASYGSVSSQNFTMYGMLGATSANITMFSASDFNSNKKVPTKKQTFNLVNATDSALLNLSLEAHVEVDVDYSAYGARTFTFMVDASGGATSFAVPLLNVTGTKEINVFTQSFAPRSIDERTNSQILSNPNVSLSTFNPQPIGESASRTSIFIGLMKSNSSCNVPNPNNNCYIINPGSMNMQSFNPLSAIIGGGKINFVMGMSGVKIMYVNVDMLASGPPDVSFENQNNVNESRTSSGFGKIMKFGSKGPKIYDYVLVAMPYNEANVKENAPVNLSIPVFYDENWNQIWNSTSNGTKIANFAGNYSHYSTKQTEWDVLMNQTICTRGTLTDSSQINASSPCYIDITKNTIWIRLPHFSGNGPQVNGLSSSDRYTTNGIGIDFLNTTSAAGSYSAIREIYINVTSNITDFKNITVYIYNSSTGLNLTYWNTTEPSLYINVSNLVDGLWFFNATARNDTFANYTILRNVTVDTTYPLIYLNNTGLDAPYSNFSRTWIFMNTNVTETNEANITFTLYNTTGVVNVTTFSAGNRNMNWTGLSNGIYTYNATVTDLANYRNTTATRTITLDTTAPAITVYSPINNSVYYPNQTIVINFIASDALGFATTRWYNFNLTGTTETQATNYSFSVPTALNFTSTGMKSITFYINDSVGNLGIVIYVINVTAINTNTTFVASGANYTADANKTSVIVPYNTSLATVNLTNLSQQFSIDLTQLLLNGQSGVAAIGSNSNLTLSARDSSGNYSVFIPSGINITGGSSWDGKVALPNINTSTQFSAPGSGGSITVIEVGSSGELNFTSPVKIVLGGQAGKKGAWSRGTPTLTNITTICNSGNATNTTAPGNINATTTRECYLDDGSDLNIWTYHFTTFASFTPPAAAAATTTTTTDSSSGGGTYVPSFWTGTYIYNDKELSEKPILVKEMSVKERITIKVGGAQHEVGVVALTTTTATINVSSTPQQATLILGESKKFDVDNNGYYDVKVTLNGITNNKASLTLSSIDEKIAVTAGTSQTGATPGNETTTDAGTPQTEDQTKQQAEESSRWYLWVILVIVVIVLIWVIMRSRTNRYSGR